jgi:hypothetical protein
LRSEEPVIKFQSLDGKKWVWRTAKPIKIFSKLIDKTGKVWYLIDAEGQPTRGRRGRSQLS